MLMSSVGVIRLISVTIPVHPDSFSPPCTRGERNARTALNGGREEKLSGPVVMMSPERMLDRRIIVSRTHRGWKYRTAASCGVTGKTSFKSTVAARSFVDTRDEWRGEVSRVYRCEFCDWFHLTSRPSRWELIRTETAAA